MMANGRPVDIQAWKRARNRDWYTPRTGAYEPESEPQSGLVVRLADHLFTIKRWLGLDSGHIQWD
jgi:hypothetical protein